MSHLEWPTDKGMVWITRGAAKELIGYCNFCDAEKANPDKSGLKYVYIPLKGKHTGQQLRIPQKTYDNMVAAIKAEDDKQIPVS